MKQGLVSIITPCYNGEKYIKETIESVIAQSYCNWEMIIVDDGSTDCSQSIINEYVKKDNRIVLLQQENAGSAAARNKGLHYANGQFIALLDADDIWLPCFLEKQIAFLRKKNAICVASSYGHIDASSKDILHDTMVKEEITLASMRVMNQIGCLTGLYDCSKYGKVFLKEELRSIRDDYAYWYDIVSLEGRAYGNPEVLAKYRVIENSTTGNKKKLIKKQYIFYRTYLKEKPVESFINLIRWGVMGLKKFAK